MALRVVLFVLVSSGCQKKPSEGQQFFEIESNEIVEGKRTQGIYGEVKTSSSGSRVWKLQIYRGGSTQASQYKQTWCNRSGFYKVVLPPGKYTILAAPQGAEPKEYTVTVRKGWFVMVDFQIVSLVD